MAEQLGAPTTFQLTEAPTLGPPMLALTYRSIPPPPLTRVPPPPPTAWVRWARDPWRRLRARLRRLHARVQARLTHE